jgi:hypothetical protein
MRLKSKGHLNRWIIGILLACVLAVVEQAGLAAGKLTPTTARTCSKYMSFRSVTPEELLERAEYKPQPQDDPLLRQADFHAVVTVRVFVDKSGRVVCAEEQKPAPGPDGGLNALSVITVKKWRFRSLRTPTGKRVGMQGDLTFHLDH